MLPRAERVHTPRVLAMTTLSSYEPGPPAARMEGRVAALRPLALNALARMYRPEQGRFAFCLRRRDGSMRLEGSSDRYTAIALIGLADESADTARDVLHGHTPVAVCERLLNDAPTLSNLGDVALIHWASTACGASPRDAVR